MKMKLQRHTAIKRNILTHGQIQTNKQTNKQHKTTDISPFLCKEVKSPELWAY